MAKIHNIIFDLGGVFLDLDINSTIKAYNDMGFTPEMYQYDKEHSRYFLKFEIGEISTNEFRNGIRELLKKDISDTVLDEAWNGMILGFQKVKIEILRDLKKKYRTFLLSNTNEMHEEIYAGKLLATTGFKMADLFEKIYYSHEVGLAKPDPAIFQKVLNENGLIPEQTLYIDDLEKNIHAAERLGLHCFLFPQNGDLKEIYAKIQ
jgi:putative hydrolase of the HAD superfamily